MSNRIPKISFVLPVYNEESNLMVVYESIKKACSESDVDYEIIFVDDGSTDSSLGVMKKLKSSDNKANYVSLSRNFGHQNAFFAGMSHSTGDAVITMDADMQHPPALIPKMVGMWRKGAEIVYTVKNNPNLPFIKGIIVKASYWFISKVSGLKLNFGQSDFRLIDRKVLKIILDMPEYHKFLRGQVSWIGFRQEGIPYDVEKRHSGKAKYSYGKLYNLALDGIFSFGRYPLHLIMLLSLIVFAASFCYIAVILCLWILKSLNIIDVSMPPGWTDLIMGILLLGSIQLMAIGILGEFIGRVFDQTKGRPVFIVRESSVGKKEDVYIKAS
ncbi:glycosyltransferase family 2 protein [Candidatus Omnitrophota bacterium]